VKFTEGDSEANFTGATNPITAIHAGWLIDGTGGPIKKDMLLKIEQGKIHTLRPYGPGDEKLSGLIDWSQYTVLPGLIDSHVHLFMSGTSDADIRQDQLTAGYPIQEAIRCATYNGARLLNLMEHGQLVRGKSVTLLAVAGTPSSLPGSLSEIEHILVNGDRVESPTS